MRKTTLLVLFAAAAVAAPRPARAADIRLTANVQQGFWFQPGFQGTIGYITALTVGGTALTADIPVTNPLSGPTHVVAVLSSVTWAGGLTDPVALQAYVTKGNQAILTNLKNKGLSTTAIIFSVSVVGFDPMPAVWATMFQGPSSGNALIAKAGSTLDLTLGLTSNGAVPQPPNYELQLTVMPPAGLVQTFQFCTGAGTCVMKAWGVALQ